MVSLKRGDRMQKYEYTVKFLSAKDDVKKLAVIKKIQDTLKPYVADGTLEATVTAISVITVEVGETYPIPTS